jgi:adenylate cyclase
MSIAIEDEPEGERLHRALCAYLRERFTAPVEAILVLAQSLDDDAKGKQDEGTREEVQPILRAASSLQDLAGKMCDPAAAGPDNQEFLRILHHDLNEKLAVVQGYGDRRLRHLQEQKQRLDQKQTDTLLRLLNYTSRLTLEILRTNAFLGPQPGDIHATDIVEPVLQSITRYRQARASPAGYGRILLVDDNDAIRDLTRERLEHEGHSVAVMSDGRAAIHRAEAGEFDLILVDLIMPGMNGFEFLVELKSRDATRGIPVIMVSSLSDLGCTAGCIEAGAEDFLLKPVSRIILQARTAAAIEKSRLRKSERDIVASINEDKEKSQKLLRNMLPEFVVRRLNGGEHPVAERIQDATVLFSDIVGFTSLSKTLEPKTLVALLNAFVTAVDRRARELGVEKIKTIGDAYMAVAGLAAYREDHAATAARLAFSMREIISDVAKTFQQKLQIRIGLHTGSVMAGVIGTEKYAYDVWGDTVNMAHRMESHGIADAIHLSHACRQQLPSTFIVETRTPPILVDDKWEMLTYLLLREEPGNEHASAEGS